MDIENTQKVHRIGHLLEDAKVTIKQDFSFEVAGVKTVGKDGDVNNMPRWMGEIVQDAGLGTMESTDMITELKQALSKEKMVGQYAISTLEPHFYIKLKESMKLLERDDFNRIEDLMLQLFRMRRGKLVTLADTTKLTSDLHSKLSVEEHVFYKTIRENSLEFERQIRGDTDE
ncbi:MAG: DNA replication complex GINS family protein [Nitrosopumilus sp. B06]|nr:MAG: DNA replication complex GINS family protein [Nitrosopumilus sp. B06]